MKKPLFYQISRLPKATLICDLKGHIFAREIENNKVNLSAKDRKKHPLKPSNKKKKRTPKE